MSSSNKKRVVAATPAAVLLAARETEKIKARRDALLEQNKQRAQTSMDLSAQLDAAASPSPAPAVAQRSAPSVGALTIVDGNDADAEEEFEHLGSARGSPQTTASQQFVEELRARDEEQKALETQLEVQKARAAREQKRAEKAEADMAEMKASMARMEAFMTQFAQQQARDNGQPGSSSSSSSEGSSDEDARSNATPASASSSLPSSQPQQRQQMASAYGAQQHIINAPIERAHKLTIIDAQNSTKLTSWFRAVERQVAQQGAVNDPARVVQEASWALDEQVDLFWRDEEQRRADEGLPRATWSDMKVAITKYYVPTMDHHRARDEMMNIAQQAKEDLVRYMLRVSDNFARCAGGITEDTAVRVTLKGMQQTAWPQAYRGARTKINSESPTERIAKMSALRAYLTEAQTIEPVTAANAWAFNRSSAQPAPEPKAAPVKKTGAQPWKKRAAAVDVQQVQEALGALGIGDTAEGNSAGAQINMEMFINAIAAFNKAGGAPKKMRCHRCKKEDHRVADCKEPETRACHACKEVGHLAKDCPKKASN